MILFKLGCEFYLGNDDITNFHVKNINMPDIPTNKKAPPINISSGEKKIHQPVSQPLSTQSTAIVTDSKNSTPQEEVISADSTSLPENSNEPSPTEVKHAIWRAKIHLMNLTDELQLVLQTQKLSPLLRQVAAEQKCQMPGNANDWQPIKVLQGVIDKMPKDMTDILLK